MSYKEGRESHPVGDVVVVVVVASVVLREFNRYRSIFHAGVILVAPVLCR